MSIGMFHIIRHWPSGWIVQNF